MRPTTLTDAEIDKIVASLQSLTSTETGSRLPCLDRRAMRPTHAVGAFRHRLEVTQPLLGGPDELEACTRCGVAAACLRADPSPEGRRACAGMRLLPRVSCVHEIAA